MEIISGTAYEISQESTSSMVLQSLSIKAEAASPKTPQRKQEVVLDLGYRSQIKVLQEVGRKIEIQILLADLSACSRTRNLVRGKQVHQRAIECQHDSCISVVNRLINMYAKCGTMVDAREVFDSVRHPTLVSWTALILGYSENGDGHTGLELFTSMMSEGHEPDSVAFVAGFMACATLAVEEDSGCSDRSKALHNCAVENGCISDVYVQSTLVDMYAKCGSMVDAREVFDNMKCPNVVSWTVLITGYAENGQGQSALNLFIKMRSKGPAPDYVTFVAVLKTCTSLAVKEKANGWGEWRARGKALHNLVVENSCNLQVYIQSSLMDMYAKLGSMVDAREVFDSMKHLNMVSWSVLILGYAENGQGHIALELFTRMAIEGPGYSSAAYVASLKACSSLAEWKDRGKAIHNLASENDYNSDVYVQGALVDMYAKCGSMVDARQEFDSLKNPTVVSWTALILGYADNGEGYISLDIFTRMRTEGPAPDSVTFMAALMACTITAVKEGVSAWIDCRDKGKAIHNLASENGCDSDFHVQSVSIDMYAKCGNMVEAFELFESMEHPNVVSWTVLILGYAENGQGHSALILFTRMRTEGFAADSFTFVAALKACTSLAVKGISGLTEYRDRGKALQDLIAENGYTSDFSKSCLVELYTKCGSLVDAREVLDSMKHPDIVSWNGLLLLYADNGQGQTALELFTRMRRAGTVPDSVSFVAALKACSLLGALEFGRAIHSEIDDGHLFDVGLVTCLVDFYAKCGSLREARSVFDMYEEIRNEITWSAMLAGYSNSGDHETVFRLFQEMQDAGFRPNGVTLLSILTCCSRAGLVEKGKECFDEMLGKFGIIPTVEHYNCMVDIFGRANKLENAMALLEGMPYTPNAVTWRTILSACRKWKNVEIGKLAFDALAVERTGDG